MTELPQTLVEAIDQYLSDGMPVLDANGERIGHVKVYSIAAGYLMVGTGLFEETDRYLPFRLIRSIDPHQVIVSATKDALASAYTQLPTISTVVEQRLVPGPHDEMAAKIYDVQVIASGYDERPIEFNRVDLSGVADRLAVGMMVYDARGERLGDLIQYDAERNLMVVERGIFKPKTLLVPFSAIREIHPATCTVYLSLPSAVLRNDHVVLPEDA